MAGAVDMALSMDMMEEEEEEEEVEKEASVVEEVGGSKESEMEPLAILVEMFPDADPTWLKTRLNSPTQTLQTLIDAIMDGKEQYDKRASSSSQTKRGVEEVEEGWDGGGRKKVKVEKSEEYKRLCQRAETLAETYPTIPINYLTTLSLQLSHDYTSIRRHIDALVESPPAVMPFRYVAVRKGKRKRSGGAVVCEEFERERRGYEEGKTEILCMDSGGCKYPFPRSEIQRFLGSEVFAGYEKLCQETSLRTANLANLEHCPFCPFAQILPTPTTELKLFHCLSPTCSIISCRLCKRANHIPKTCEEVKQEDRLDARHVVEEAMTDALLRECGKCGMRQITGYDHFSTDPNGHAQVGKQCPLWDDAVKRNNREVEEAAKAAIQNVVKEGKAGDGVVAEEIEKDLGDLMRAAGKGKAANPQPAPIQRPAPPPIIYIPPVYVPPNPHIQPAVGPIAVPRVVIEPHQNRRRRRGARGAAQLPPADGADPLALQAAGVPQDQQVQHIHQREREQFLRVRPVQQQPQQAQAQQQGYRPYAPPPQRPIALVPPVHPQPPAALQYPVMPIPPPRPIAQAPRPPPPIGHPPHPPARPPRPHRPRPPAAANNNDEEVVVVSVRRPPPPQPLRPNRPSLPTQGVDVVFG
ncbi:hypothetical protein HDU67_000614, partial [Dinochytrium kinnereticum]